MGTGAMVDAQRAKALQDHRVVVFVRAPAVGRVKTRLAKHLDPRTVMELYQAFVADVLAMLAAGGYPVVICYHPKEATAQMIAWLGETHRYLPQEGADLGARMANAFKAVFAQGCRRALLIGTDFPDLPSTIIRQGFEGLMREGAVLGPTYDGGYYLIGFAREHFAPDVFNAVPWGTQQVFEDTLARFKRLGRRPAILPRWRDIDEYKDLLAFRNDEAPGRQSAHHTRALLAALERNPNFE